MGAFAFRHSISAIGAAATLLAGCDSVAQGGQITRRRFFRKRAVPPIGRGVAMAAVSLYFRQLRQCLCAS